MSRTGRRTLLMLLLGLLVAGLSLTALAAEEGGEGDEGAASTTTTINSGLSPAVPIEVQEPTPPPVDWTYRYLVPTGLVLAGLVVVITAVKYFTDVVRRRYRIVE
ncbi:MAG TPA: hypothetical protein VFO17_02055 [Acidimicrobiia bacterium]|nr:hypothetical protein [Acidimicrobiia bacterium]